MSVSKFQHGAEINLRINHPSCLSVAVIVILGSQVLRLSNTAQDQAVARFSEAIGWEVRSGSRLGC